MNGAPHHQLPCGCWLGQIVTMGGGTRWLFLSIACNAHVGSTTYDGIIPVSVDPDIPVGAAEIRNADGSVAATIRNIGDAR